MHSVDRNHPHLPHFLTPASINMCHWQSQRQEFAIFCYLTFHTNNLPSSISLPFNLTHHPPDPSHPAQLVRLVSPHEETWRGQQNSCEFQ